MVPLASPGLLVDMLRVYGNGMIGVGKLLPLTLACDHRALIAGSAVDPDVGAERGYRSVTKRADIK